MQCLLRKAMHHNTVFYRNSLKPYTSRKMDAIDWWTVDCGARHPAQPRATSRKVAHIGSM